MIEFNYLTVIMAIWIDRWKVYSHFQHSFTKHQDACKLKVSDNKIKRLSNKLDAFKKSQ